MSQALERRRSDVDAGELERAESGYYALYHRAASDETIRQGGIISGQAMMAAADTAMALAAIASTGEFRPAATVDMTTSFIRPAGRGELDVAAHIVKSGRRMIFARCEITAVDTGKLVATATATFALP